MIAAGVSVYALSVAQTAMAQSTCGDGSPGPVCTINNTETRGEVVGTPGTVTIVTNSGEINDDPGTPDTRAISQAGSFALFVNNQAGGSIDNIDGYASYTFGVTNAGEIDGFVFVHDAGPTPFDNSIIYYIDEGGTAGSVTLGTTGYSTANYIQRGAQAGTDTILAGGGLDIYTKSYAATQSVAMGQYELPDTFELEGYEVRGTDTTLTLTGTGQTIALMGDGNVVNDGTIGMIDTTGVYPIEVTPAAIFTYHTTQTTYPRAGVEPGAPQSIHTIGHGNELTSFTNNGIVNGDIRIAAATFTNNGNVNLTSNGPGTVIRGAADKDFTFRNTGTIEMTDSGARPSSTAIEAEFEDGTDAAVRLTTAVNATELNEVTIENGENGLISGGLSFTGVASDFTFTNDGEIEIGDNPFEIDRAVEINLGNFEVAQNAALREDAVANSVTITNNGTLDGGIEAEVTTRVLSFTNNGHINADVTDAQAAAVELAADDWADTPDGEDVNDAESVTFVNSASGTIAGSVELEANASLVTITNNGSITQALRSDHGVTVGANTDGNLREALFVEQETALGAELVFNNTGTISNADYAGGAVFLDLEAGDVGSGLPEAVDADATVTVTNSGSITASGGNYLTFPPAAGLTQGQIGIDFNVALAVVAEAEGTSSVTITNQQGGLIDARGTAHMWTGSVQVVPDQQPDSGGLAIVVAEANDVTIVNHGTIRGGPGGSLNLPNGSTLVPINAGDVDFEGVWGGAIDTFGPSADSVTNSSTGVIEGGIALRSGNDRFENYGTVDGDLYLGEGDDTFVQAWDATFTGTADGGAGTDTFVLDLTGSEDEIVDLGIYDQLVSFEVLETRGTGGGVSAGDGDDNLSNSGTLNGPVDLGGGDNTYTNAPGGTINNNVTAGSGNDEVANQGTINGRVDLGEGNNAFTNAQGGTIIGDVQSGSGDDQMANQGTINGEVNLGDGANSFTNAPDATVNGTVTSGTGSDNLTNQGTIAGDVVLDGASLPPSEPEPEEEAEQPPVQGDARMATFAAASAEEEVAASAMAVSTGGDDVLTNEKTISGSVYAGAGNDRIVNSGKIAGDVDLGDGNDVVELSGSWEIGGTIKGGAGSDTVKVAFGNETTPEADLPILDLSGYQEIEQFQVDSGVGKIGGKATFEAISINGGRLIGAEDSVITADVNVGNGGIFGSAGTVIGDIAVASGGTLSPGASPAVMNVVGDVSLAGGSITTFEFVPSPGQSDQLIIDGDLAIASGAVLNMTGNRPLTPGTAYDMIVADSITGEFTIGTWDHSKIAGFLRYVDGASQDRLQLMGTFLPTVGTSPQAIAGIDYVNALLIAGDASPALLDAVPVLLDTNGYASAAAFGLVSPEPYATAIQLGVEQGLSLAKTVRSGVAAAPQAETGLYAFAGAIGNWRSLSADSHTGTSRAKSESFGFLGGIGYGSRTGSVAAFVGYIDSNQRIAALDARTDADGMVAGLAAHLSTGGLELNGLIAYDWSKAHTSRAVPDGRVQSSKYDLHGLVLDASAAYALPFSEGWALQPQVGVTHVSNRRGSASETGSAAFALDVERRRTKATFLDAALVLRGGRQAEASFKPWLQAGLRHQLEGERTYATGGFQGTDIRFTVPGAPRKDTVVIAGAGFSADLSAKVRVFAGYQGEFGGGTGHAVSGGIRIGF